MCCRASIVGLPPDWKDILAIAGFLPIPGDLTRWLRNLSEASIKAEVIQHLSPLPLTLQVLNFSLTPSINDHTYQDHLTNAASASVMFKTLMTLAEKSEGQIKQQSLVGPCRQEAGASDIVVAEYPGSPLTFQRLCFGFREALLKGVGQHNPQEVESWHEL